MYILLWLVFGAFIGWLASILTSNNKRMGLFSNIVVGLVGAVIGGALTNALGWGTINTFSWTGTLFSILGAVLLLTIINLLSKSR